GEEAAALATEPLRLLAQAIELGLLLCRGLLVAFDLLRFRGIDAGAAIDGGKLAFEPQTDLVATARSRCIGRGRIGRRSARGCAGGERKAELRQCGRRAKNEGG